MALNYSDPGTQIQEQINVTSVNVNTTGGTPAIVAIGNRSAQSTNEPITRGTVYNETLTVANTSPHTATLAHLGDRKVSNTIVTQTLGSQVSTLPAAALSYPAATLTGTVAGPFDLTSNNEFGLQLDSGDAVTLILESGANSVVISGSTITVTSTYGTLSAATRAEVAAAINLGLAGAASLGYGSTYAAVAADATSGISLTSPLATAQSNVTVLPAFFQNASATLGFTAPVTAPTVLRIADAYFQPTAGYTVQYVATNYNTDRAANTVSSVVRLGSFANVTSFTNPPDYTLSSGNIVWSGHTAATFTGGVAGPFNVSTNNTLTLAFDGQQGVTITLASAGSPPPGWVAPASSSAATAAEIANNINAYMAAALNYGPAYRAVATTSGNFVVLTSPTLGSSSIVELILSATNDATQAIFGLQNTQLPFVVVGTGSQPIAGTVYFATYNYVRPSSQYNVPQQFFSENAAIAALTPTSATNTLMLYAHIAFQQGSTSVICVQVDDATAPGNPTVNEVLAALNGLTASSAFTDVVIADTRLASQLNLKNFISVQSSVTNAQYCNGWFGMAIGTQIGDTATPNTFVYTATQTLQVAPDDPARGRLNLVAPSGVQYTITNSDGTETTVTLDSTAVCAALAGLQGSFTSPATSMASKTIIGFDPTTFPTYNKAQRAALASQGTLVITNIGGNLTILDPVTTEAGGGNLPEFKYRSTTAQKDNVTLAIIQSLNTNLRGVVPTDLADFLFAIKTFVGETLVALINVNAIGPFQTATGAVRDIDLATDIQASQSTTDPTSFNFTYTYFLRYPALRFFGTFTISAPTNLTGAGA